ncbi:MAG: hypothetical protein A4E65_03394 [Syntrophorhabdus sp. PtaU1.Bin153]|nr:MAG: hypothetical protein A4E65_03394 [Syntrophorhabdus sp. PtaU1.Bin153]
MWRDLNVLDSAMAEREDGTKSLSIVQERLSLRRGLERLVPLSAPFRAGYPAHYSL